MGNKQASTTFAFFIIAIAINLSFSVTTKAANKPGTSVYKPMTSSTVYFHDTWQKAPDCFAQDDDYMWQALGSLRPGESYTFIPDRPICAYPEEAPFVGADLVWDSSQLQLSSVIPMGDLIGDGDPGQPIIAPNTGNHAQLCMFMSPFISRVTVNSPYFFTVKNVGTSTAYNITMKGEAHNGYPFFWNRICYNGDADHDGWNDAFEKTMTELTYHATGAGPNIYNNLIGTKYAHALVNSTTTDDEIDTYPPDVNDDGVIDQKDVDRVVNFFGQGSGVSIDRISANPGEDTYIYNQVGIWRRYDLNGDGWVDQIDIDMEKKLVGMPYPATDIFPPTVIIRNPTSTPPVSSLNIPVDIVDNGLISKVQVIQSGKIVATLQPGNTIYVWRAPKSRGTYSFSVIATDSAGNKTTKTAKITIQ